MLSERKFPYFYTLNFQFYCESCLSLTSLLPVFGKNGSSQYHPFRSITNVNVNKRACAHAANF